MPKVIINLLFSPIYKLNFIMNMYECAYRIKTKYIGLVLVFTNLLQLRTTQTNSQKAIV